MAEAEALPSRPVHSGVVVFTASSSRGFPFAGYAAGNCGALPIALCQCDLPLLRLPNAGERFNPCLQAVWEPTAENASVQREESH
jgi:hypothetical protein